MATSENGTHFQSFNAIPKEHFDALKQIPRPSRLQLYAFYRSISILKSLSHSIVPNFDKHPV
jgi:hypothetical protein